MVGWGLTLAAASRLSGTAITTASSLPMIAIWTVSRSGPIASGIAAGFGGNSRLTKLSMSGMPSSSAWNVMPVPRQAQISTASTTAARAMLRQLGREKGAASGLAWMDAGIWRALGGRDGN